MKRYGIGAAALAVAVAGSAQAGDAVQWAEADGGNGHWYMDVTMPSTWAHAEEAAELVGGYLATTVNESEFQYVWSMSGHE